MSTVSSTDAKLFKTLANAEFADVNRMDHMPVVKEQTYDQEYEGGQGFDAAASETSYPDYGGPMGYEDGYGLPPTAVPPQPQRQSQFDSVVSEELLRRKNPPSVSTNAVPQPHRPAEAAQAGAMSQMPMFTKNVPPDDMLAKQ